MLFYSLSAGSRLFLCANMLNLVMMYIKSMPFYSLSVGSRLFLCAKPRHDCGSTNKQESGRKY